MASERRWRKPSPGIMSTLAAKLADPNVRRKSTSIYSGTVNPVAVPITHITTPNETFDVSRAWQTPFRLPVQPEEVVVDVANSTAIQPRGRWDHIITCVKSNTHTTAGAIFGVCVLVLLSLLSIWLLRCYARRVRSNDEVLWSNPEVLRSNADMQQRIDENDTCDEPSETSRSSILNAQLRQDLETSAANERKLQSELDSEASKSSALNAHLRQDLETSAANERKLQSELDAAKRDLLAKDKTIKDRDDTIASNDTALKRSDDALNTAETNLDKRDETIKNLNDELDPLKRKSEEKDKTITNQEREIASHETTKRELYGQLAAKDAELTSTKNDLKVKDTEVKTKSDLIAEMERGLASHEITEKGLRTELAAKDNTLTEQGRKLASVESDLQARDAELKAKNNTIADQGRALESTGAIEKTIRDELTTAVESVANLQKEVNSLKGNSYAVADTIRRLESTIAIQKRTLDVTTEAEKKIRGELKTKTKSNEDLRKEVDSLKAERRNYDATIKRHDTEMETKDGDIQSRIDKIVNEALLAPKEKSILDRKPPSFFGSGSPTSIIDGAAGKFAESAKGGLDEVSHSHVQEPNLIDIGQDDDSSVLASGHIEEGLTHVNGYTMEEKPVTDIGSKDRGARENELTGGKPPNTLPDTATTDNATDVPTSKNNNSPAQTLDEEKETPETGARPKKRGLKRGILSHDSRKQIFREGAANIKSKHGATCIVDDNYSALAQTTGNFNGLQLEEVLEQASIEAMEIAARFPDFPILITPEHLNRAVNKVAGQYNLQLTIGDQGPGQDEEDSTAIGTSSTPRPRKSMSYDERKKYLQSYRLRSIPRQEDIDWDPIAKMTEGYRGEDLRELIVKAFFAANSNQRTMINQEDLESIISKMDAGEKSGDQDFDNDQEPPSSNLPPFSNPNNNPPNANGLPPRPKLHLPPKIPSWLTETPDQQARGQNQNGLPPNTPTGPRADSHTGLDINNNNNNLPNVNGLPPRPNLRLPPKLPSWLTETQNEPANSQNQAHNDLPSNTPTGPRAESTSPNNNNTNTKKTPRPHRPRRRNQKGKSDNQSSTPDPQPEGDARHWLGGYPVEYGENQQGPSSDTGSEKRGVRDGFGTYEPPHARRGR